MRSAHKVQSVAVGIVLLFVATSYFLEHTIPNINVNRTTSGRGSDTQVGALPDATAKRIDLVVDISKLFVNWAFAIIGVNAFFFAGFAEAKFQMRPLNLILSELAAATGAMSLVLAQIVISNTVALLEKDQFSPSSTLIAPYVTAQYWTLLASAAITFANTHHFFWIQSSARAKSENAE